ncbi:MAG: hypothetical protein KC684_00830 [Candidatus Omnitrophica bacterium]|nr:hypothetical protein [Candidatus Omnitrophota bacterium]
MAPVVIKRQEKKKMVNVSFNVGEFDFIKSEITNGIIEKAGPGLYRLQSGSFKQILKQSEYDKVMAKQRNNSVVEDDPEDEGNEGDKKTPQELRAEELSSENKDALMVIASSYYEEEIPKNTKKDEIIKLIVDAEFGDEE